MKYTGAQIVVNILKKHNVDIVFGYPGAANAPLYEEMSKSDIRHILPRGEQAGAHEANGYARVSGKVGVCMATSGPGATNLITGIANAYMDSIPIVAITGQVTTDQIGLDAFQEADITGATAPFCKHNYLVKDVCDLPRVLNNAFYIAATGRPGPVLIDLPIDVQLAELDDEYCNVEVDIRGYKPTYKGNGLQIKRAVKEIDLARQPAILVGGGVILGDAKQEFLEFAKKINAPVVSTLMGVGTIPTNHELNFGMVGSHGFASANYALQNADLLIVAGARAADRAVSFSKNMKDIKVIHIDIDPAEIGKILSATVPIVGNLKDVLVQLLNKVESKEKNIEWIDNLNKRRKTPKYDTGEGEFINPKYAIKMLSTLVDKDTIVTTEVGQNQIWTIRCFEMGEENKLLTSGGLGTMGYGLPAAIGAKFASMDKCVVAIEGDGSFQMSMGELATIVGNNLDIKIVLLKNNRLGMVNELQKNNKYTQYAVFLDGSPNFCTLVGAYGIPSESISKHSELGNAFKKMLSHKGAYMLELIVDPEESTFD